VKAATYGEIERFCQCDGWTQTSGGGSGRRGRQRHLKFQKVLADGETLQTQISHDRDKTPSAGRWKAILRTQLRVAEEDFWEALSTMTPVDRTRAASPPTPIPVQEWVRRGLRKQGFSDEQIDALDPERAQQELYRRWSATSHADDSDSR
jgi:hypothetical protein